MKKIIKYWNENRFMIIIIVIVIVFILALIYAINTIFAQMNNSKNEINLNNISTSGTEPVQSIVTGEYITENQVDKLDTLNEFIKYCNEKNLENAYNLLSEECKEELYPTINDFTQNYYNQVFKGNKKNVSVENWVNDIYRIEVNDDYLSTGVFTNSNPIQDYITIITDESGNYKLNINKYIGRNELNKNSSSSNIEIVAVESDYYIDYQVITYKVTNNTDNQILLDDNLLEDSIYIEDRNDIKYSAYMHELATSEITVAPKQTKEVKIKYYSQYSSTKIIEKIVFSRIITNYGLNEGNSYTKIEIEL